MEQIVRSFLEKDMLLSPEIFSQVKEKQDSISEIVKSVQYSLVLNSLDSKISVASVAKPVSTLEQVKPQNNTAFGRFVQDNKTPIVQEIKAPDVKQEIKIELKTETPKEVKIELPLYNHNIKIVKSFEVKSSKHSIEDFIKASNERYEFLRKILSEKVDLQNLTSMNKIDPYAEVSLIGIVKSVEKKERTIVEIEDSTGSVKLMMEAENHKFLVGDVIGVSGTMKKEYFMPKKIVFPDAPIRRSVTMSQNDASILFCGKILPDSFDKILKVAQDNKANYIFVTGKHDEVEKISTKIPSDMKILYSPIYLFADGNEPFISPKFSSSSIIPLSSPSIVDIEGVGVLVYNGSSYEKLPRNDEGVLEIIKRRYIPLKLSAENFIMESVPDVVYSALDKAGFKNYKGSTLVSTEDSATVLVNLKTRETKVIPLVS